MSTIKEIREEAERNEVEIAESLDQTEENEKKFDELQKNDKKFIRKEQKFRNFQKSILNVAIILFIIWLLFFVFIGMSAAPNNDMTPRVNGGDMLLYDRLNKSPSKNDVVIYKKKGITHIGRVLAKGGDTVEILEKGGVLINNNKLVEGKIYQSTYPYPEFQKYPVTLEKNEFFVLADAREEGEDSRFLGPVKKKELQGVVIALIRRRDL